MSDHEITEDPAQRETSGAALAPRRSRAWTVPLTIAGSVLGLLAAGGLLLYRAERATNHVTLASQPKGVTVVEARVATYRASKRYVATVEPWVRANMGPQLVAAYVDTVLVRPGAVVKRGDVLATLDCRNASAESSAVAMRARAMEAKQTALAKESSRIEGLLDGGFVSPNEVDQKTAETASMAAQLLATRAQLAGRSLEVSDCILRAPFEGEVADRMIDPGAFVRPGQAILSLVDRSTVRVIADVPENDFAAVSPGVEVRMRMLATGKKTVAKVSRRAPGADPATRTVRVEIDLADPGRTIPVGTTAEVELGIGEPVAAVQIPLAAALVRGSKATVFVITGQRAHLTAAAVLGEDAGQLFLDPGAVPAGSQIVLEGRALLRDGDAVDAKPVKEARP